MSIVKPVSPTLVSLEHNSQTVPNMSSRYSSVLLLNNIEQVETTSASNDSPVIAAEARAGVHDESQSTTSSSNTPLLTPSHTSSGASNHQQQSTKSSQTSASSEPLHLLARAPTGRVGVYMPNVDLLHIGAQFSLNVVEDEGHIDIEGGAQVEVEVEQDPDVPRDA